MYLDVLSPDAYGSYSRKLAKLAGIQTAVYWSELLDIIPKVQKKKKYNEDGYFKLDREYIESRTTIEVADQLNCDSLLNQLGVLEVDPADSNQVRVKLEAMTDLLVAETEVNSNQVKLKKQTAARNNNKAQCEAMKRHISELDAELAVSLKDWIDAIYANKKYLTYKVIDTFIDTVKKYSPDSVVQNAVVKLAMIHVYSDANWAINLYEKDYKKATKPHTNIQKQTTEINKELSF